MFCQMIGSLLVIRISNNSINLFTCSRVRSTKCASALIIGKTACLISMCNACFVTSVATSSIAFNANPSISLQKSSSSSRYRESNDSSTGPPFAGFRFDCDAYAAIITAGS